MGAPKPILGYRSRTAAAAALRAEGLTDHQIASRINAALPDGEGRIDHLRVSNLLDYRKHPRPCERQQRTVAMDAEVLDALTPAAAARGVSVNELVRRIVATVADEGLVAAVLDDDGGA